MPRREQAPFPIGALSSGSLAIDDLLRASSNAIDILIDHERLTKHEASTIQEEVDTISDESEDADDVLQEAEDLINGAVPDYVYYGGNEGDPADVGFWISWDSVEEDRRNGELTEYADVTPSFSGLAIDVNDHGNATLYLVNRGKVKQTIWEVV